MEGCAVTLSGCRWLSRKDVNVEVVRVRGEDCVGEVDENVAMSPEWLTSSMSDPWDAMEGPQSFGMFLCVFHVESRPELEGLCLSQSPRLRMVRLRGSC